MYKQIHVFDPYIDDLYNKPTETVNRFKLTPSDPFIAGPIETRRGSNACSFMLLRTNKFVRSFQLVRALDSTEMLRVIYFYPTFKQSRHLYATRSVKNTDFSKKRN